MRSHPAPATPSSSSRLPAWKCRHQPACPDASSSDAEAARIIASHPEQGWHLLCNSLVVFDDTGELHPDGRVVDPHRLELVAV
ncbi:DUF5999 family protein [Streptomyces sp. NPDC060187]|uniref:DUF5999 family protein n=1 Tax=Streptomyces sp. NPDC060187 TaxID=3347067 RepID=UPI003667C7DA